MAKEKKEPKNTKAKDKKKPKKEKSTTENNKGGRPDDYKEEYCKMMLDYFDSEKTFEREVTHISKNGEFTTYETEANPMPQFSIFARKHAGVSRQTLLSWTTKYPEFLDAYNTCKEIQKEFILENGMSGRYNPQFTKFVAINVTDMKDKSEIDHTSGGDKIAPHITFVKGRTQEDGK